MMKKLLLASILSVISGYGIAQTESNATIKVIALIKKDTVVLRWAPTTPLAWEIGNQYGYVVKRYTVTKDGLVDTVNNPVESVLTVNPVKPLPLNNWETLAKADNYAAIAAQALYGNSFVVSAPSNSTVQFYNQSQEKESRYSFALLAADHSAGTAQALGLRFVDTNLNKKEKYVYRVTVAHTHPQYKIAAGTLFVDPEKQTKLPAPEDLKSEFGDQSVSLSWKSFYLQDIYVSYKVERSDDEGKTFKPANDQIFINTRNNENIPERTFYVDSLPQNYKVYFYRVRGLTPFGETGPPSEAIKGVGLGSSKGAIAVIELAHEYSDGSGAYIQWRFPKDMRSTLNGFYVAKAKSAKGPFVNITENILAATADIYIDKKPDAVNYYVVKAVSKDGSITTSFPALLQLDDAIPPAVPAGLNGVISPNGLVTINWTANSEPDLTGYKVFKANSLDEEFVQVTKEIIRSNQFTDSINLNTLTKNVFFKVIALDNRFNASEYSTALELQRPDIVAPASTQFSRVDPNNGSIYLEWLQGVDDDIQSYQLFRTEEKDTTFTLLATIESTDSNLSYSDKAISPGVTYRYKLVVNDQAGLQSTSTFVNVTAIDYGVRPAITDIRTAVNRESREIKLQWTYKGTGITGFRIFKAIKGSPLRIYKFVPTNSFSDKSLIVNNKYIYSIIAVFENGAESEMSKEILVEY
jgi:fibronectin type 3 domain-containing protein